MTKLTAGGLWVRRILILWTLLICVAAEAQLRADFQLSKSGGCSPLDVSFTNTTYGASPNATYRWDLGNGNTSTLPNPGAIYREEKSYTVTLTVNDGTKTSTKSATVTVYKKPTVDFAAASAKICLPAAASFTTTTTPGDGYIANYYWDFGDGQTAQGWGSSMNHQYSYEQKPTVSLTVTNSYGCSGSVTKPEALEVLPAINPSISVDKTLLCSLEESVQFTNSSTGPGTLSYAWDFGDGTRSTEKAPSKTYTRKGVYSARVTVSNADGCSVSSNPITINAAYFNTNFTNQNLCREVRFSSTSYLYPTSSLWQFGDGAMATSTYGTSHVYTAAGNYAVTLINTYNNTCKDTVSKTIKVEDKVAYNSAIEAPALICKDNYVSFQSKSSVQPSATLWTFEDGTTYNWSTQVSRSFHTPGTQTIKLTNTFGTCKEEVSKTVTINDLPDPKGFVVDYGGICGSPVTVQFRDTTPGAVKWQWRTDYYGSTFSTAQNASYPFAYDGYYTVYLTVTNAAGCTQSTSKTLSISRPSVSIGYDYTSSPKGNYDCDSLTMTFRANSNHPLKDFNWNFGDGTSSTEATPTHAFNKVGSYTITLTYTTESGCTGTVSYPVRVWDKPRADFTYSVPCGPALDLQFFDRSPFSDRWQWDFGDGGKDPYGHSNPWHHYSDTGKYLVTFINSIGHCSDTTEKEIYANQLPSYLQITKALTTCEGSRGTVTFDQRSLRINGGTWDFGDGTTMPYDTSAHDIQHTYTRTGTYTVTLLGQAPNCTLYSTTQVSVLLKQQPVLTASRSEICANESINVQVNNLAVNPSTGNVEWGQYGINGFEYENGKPFSGSIGYYPGWSYTAYKSQLSNFQAGNTKLRAIVNSRGCQDTTNYINLKVNGPIAGFKIKENSLCFKGEFTFEDTSRTATTTALRTWTWNFGDGQSETRTTGGTVTHRYANPNSYYAQLTVTDASGCTATYGNSVYARGPKASFSASGMFVPNVPLNTTVTFYNSTMAYYSNSVNYTWDYGDGHTSTGYQGSNQYTAPGTNTVILVATDPSLPCSDTARQVINVKDFNTAFAFSTSFLTGSTCPPVMVRINNLSVGYYRLKWDFGDGTVAENVSYPSHTYYQPGTYRITLYTYGYNGLTGTYKDSVVVNAPSATFSADVLEGCGSLNVTLQATAENTASYTWDFGDGTLSAPQGNPASYNYLLAGVYQPRLIIKDENGCRSSAQLPDPIVVDSLQMAIKGIPALICDSALIQFAPDVHSLAADRLKQPLIYHWDFGTGNPADTANIQYAAFRYTRPGTYTVRLKVTSPYGCVQETSERVTVLEKARGSITGAVQTCEGATVQFSGAASIQSAVQWQWNFANGNTASSQAAPAQLYAAPGTYNVQLVLNNNGCYDTTYHTLAVHPKPTITMNTRQALLCQGSSLQLSATGGSTYAWTPAATLDNPAAANPVASPLTHTTYKVLVTTEHGCSRSDSVVISVAPRIEVTATANTYICQGGNIQLQASGAATYRWIDNTAGLSNPAVANPTATPLSSTLYKVVGYDSYNCFTDTVAVQVDVHPRPTLSAGPDVEVPGGTPYQLQASGSADITGWLWSPADNLSCSNCPSPLATPRMQTTYVVEARTQYGCANTDTVVLKLQCAPANVHIPDGFTPNRDGKNDVFYIMGSGVNIIRHLRIYNRWGELIFERRNFGIHERAAGWDGRHKGKPVPIGTYVYLAEMECSAGEVITRKGTVTVFY